ncbi:MAG: 2-amino-4-hydroxy-6-hydroxymethyldihydropteridine diphosphokinase [Bacteroidetes bacterium]|nr:2-amino-4-hydroxy-6-hydroxymethyldihydropteridine diphosphokinase [Bacteroidota bacterium]
MKKELFLLLGTNLGNREENLSKARNCIQTELGGIIKVSSVYETEPWGFSSELQFLNQVIKIACDLEPYEILEKIKFMEALVGRVRSGFEGYSSRVIDIDVLLYGSEVVNTAELIIPHTKLADRLFALIPLVEIDGNVQHPILKKSMLELLGECGDSLQVSIYIEKKT